MTAKIYFFISGLSGLGVAVLAYFRQDYTTEYVFGAIATTAFIASMLIDD
jgi:hypothetical protein